MMTAETWRQPVALFCPISDYVHWLAQFFQHTACVSETPWKHHSIDFGVTDEI